MKLNGSCSRSLDPILKAHIAGRNRIVVVVVDAGQRAVFCEVVIRRIPHLRYRIVRITNAAVNLILVRLPEALVCLPAKLASGIILALIDVSIEVIREVVRYLLVLEKRQGDIADAVIRIDATAVSVMLNDDGD